MTPSAPCCPRCPATALVTSGTHGVWVQYCPRCWGMWLDHAAVQHAIGPAIDGASAVAGESLPCPSCRGSMRSWSAREVVVDRCDAHGVWFDRAELDHLVAHARVQAPSGAGPGIAGAVVGGAVLGTAAIAMTQERRESDGDTFVDAVDSVAVVAPVAEAAGELTIGAADLVVSGAEVGVEATSGVLDNIGDAVGAIFDWFS